MMREKDVDATCIPVRLDDQQWETAFFLKVAGPESKHDRRILKRNRATPLVLAVELMAHSRASVVLMRVEVQTIVDDPLVFEILLIPGEVSTHYECLKLLTQQKHVSYFLGDADCYILQEQKQQISGAQHEKFESLTREAFAHDSVVRMSGNYDAKAALSEVVGRYQARSGAPDPAGKVTH